MAQLLVNHISDTFDALQVRFPATKLVICGDFNCLDINNILHQVNLTQAVDFPTHEQTTLDLINMNLSQHCLPTWPPPTMGCRSHLSVFWAPSPTTSLPESAALRTYRPMSDSAMRRIRKWLVGHRGLS